MIVNVVDFENLEYLFVHPDVLWRLELIHDSEPAALEAFIQKLAVRGFRLMTVKVYRPRFGTVGSVCVWLLNPESFLQGELLDLLNKMVSHMKLNLLQVVTLRDNYLLGLFQVHLQSQPHD